MIRSQVASYLTHLRWIVQDTWRPFRQRVLVVVVLNVVGLAAASGSFGSLFLIARHLESGRPFVLAGMVFELGANPGAVVGLAALMALLGVASGGCLYLTEWLIAQNAQAYQVRCIRRLIRIATEPCYRGWLGLVQPSQPRTASRLFGSGARAMAMSFRQLMEGLLPTGMSLLAGAFLFLQEPVLTTLLLPALALYLVPFHYLNRGVTQIEARFDRANRDAREQISGLFDALRESETPPEDVQALAGGIMAAPGYGEVGRLYFARRLIPDKVQLLNTATFLILVTASFGYFALVVPGDAQPWADLILYVVALRFALGGVRHMTGTAVLLNRFRREASRYREFVEEAEELCRRRKRRSDAPLPERIRLSPGRDGAGFATTDTVVLERGQILWALGRFHRSALARDAAAVCLEGVAEPPVDLLGPGSRMVQLRDLTDPDDGGLQPELDRADSDFTFVMVRNAQALLRPRFRDLTPRVAGVVVIAGGEVVAWGDLDWARANADALNRLVEEDAWRDQDDSGGPWDSPDDDED